MDVVSMKDYVYALYMELTTNIWLPHLVGIKDCLAVCQIVWIVDQEQMFLFIAE
jgi:hypothetical protein